MESGTNEQEIGQGARLHRDRQARKPAIRERFGQLVERRFHRCRVEAGPRVASDQERPLEKVELVVRLRGVGAKIHSTEYSAGTPCGMLDCPSLSTEHGVAPRAR